MSLNIMITTPSLFANKGAFSSCITDDSWCRTIKVIYSFPLFPDLFQNCHMVREHIFLLLNFSFPLPSPFFIFLWAELDFLLWGNVSLLTSQVLWVILNFSRSLGQCLVNWSQHLTKWNSNSWRHLLPPKVTDIFRGLVYSPCRASQRSYFF